MQKEQCLGTGWVYRAVRIERLANGGLRIMNRFTGLLLIGGAFLSCTPSAHASIIPQAGPNPIPINQTSTTDNVQVLLATLAERTSDIKVVNDTEGRKNFNID